MRMIRLRHCTTALSLAILLAVGACKTTETPIVGQTLDSITGKHDAKEERMATAAADAIAEGKTEEALALYEKLYTNPNALVFSSANYRNRDIVLNYAQLLRKTGDAEHAVRVLSPVVESRTGRIKSNTDPILLNEFAAGNIEIGNFKKAEDILNLVLEDKNAQKFHADAYNLLGISLDAQGQHREAEQSFRQSLSGWKGDSTSVMNNLAVCLASQGRFDESIMTLRQALVMAPDKQEVARNIEMVSNLRKEIVPQPPAATALSPQEKKAGARLPADKGGPKNNDKQRRQKK